MAAILFLLRLVALAVAAGATTSSGGLDRITLQHRRDGPLSFVDSAGRERLFHGTNVVVKGPPWYPDFNTFSPDISMAAEDFQWMQKLGLNVIRLGVIWAGLEPVRGEYNETYLDQLEHVVDLAASYGVYTLFDMHQDGLSEHFCGEGLPSWAVRRCQDSLLSKPFPAPFDTFNSSSDFYVEDRLGGAPTVPTRQACETHKLGPGWHEITEEASQAYQALWTNYAGVGDAWAAMWAKVAKRFQNRTEILGFELINEPFAGDLYHDPQIMVPYPDPHNADAKNLQPAYDRVNAAVRKVDPDVLLFFAGVTWGDLGAGFTAAPGGDEYASRSVLAYHYYEPPQKSVTLQFDAETNRAQKLGTGAFLTETGFDGRDTNPVFQRPGGVADGADAALQSWAAYEWKSFCREQSPANDKSQLGDWGACKTGFAHAWPDNGPVAGFQSGYARTYARAVAGKIVSMFFNVSSSQFKLQYEVSDIDLQAAAATEIFLWPSRYPGGANVTAAASVGTVKVDYDGTGSSVRVYPGEGIKEGARVTVSISTKVDRLPSLKTEAAIVV
jgi:endoglycosylceramidase